jgi:hypothetical protein
MEAGLVDEETFRRQATAPILIPNLSPKRVRPVHRVRFRSKTDIFEEEEKSEDEWEDVDDTASDHSMAEDDGTLSTMTLCLNTHIRTYSRLYRLGILAFLLAVTLPLLQSNPVVGNNGHTLFGVRGGVIPSTPAEYMEEVAEFLRRGDTPTDVCTRWSHQSMSILFQSIRRNANETAALVNGTLYIYGGRKTTDAQQTSDTWSKRPGRPSLYSIDLTLS